MNIARDLLGYGFGFWAGVAGLIPLGFGCFAVVMQFRARLRRPLAPGFLHWGTPPPTPTQGTELNPRLQEAVGAGYVAWRRQLLEEARRPNLADACHCPECDQRLRALRSLSANHSWVPEERQAGYRYPTRLDPDGNITITGPAVPWRASTVARTTADSVSCSDLPTQVISTPATLSPAEAVEWAKAYAENLQVQARQTILTDTKRQVVHVLGGPDIALGNPVLGTPAPRWAPYDPDLAEIGVIEPVFVDAGDVEVLSWPCPTPVLRWRRCDPTTPGVAPQQGRRPLGLPPSKIFSPIHPERNREGIRS